MRETEEQAIQSILGYIRSRDPALGNWYVGISSTPRNRLFNDHSVKEKVDAWIYAQTTNSAVARAVEKAFLDSGAQGGGGGGDDTSDYVYAYKKIR